MAGITEELVKQIVQICKKWQTLSSLWIFSKQEHWKYVCKYVKYYTSSIMIWTPLMNYFKTELRMMSREKAVLKINTILNGNSK